MKNILSFVCALILLASCASEGKKEGQSTQVVKAQHTEYILNDDITKFIGNTSVPDFKFSEEFLQRHSIKGISCSEVTVYSDKPADTLKIERSMVWLMDTLGSVREQQIFNPRGEKVHTEYTVYPEELHSLSGLVDPDHSAITVIFKEKNEIQAEMRIEPQNVDTTKYFYNAQKQLDSVTVKPLNGAMFFILFTYDKETGLLTRRVIRQPDVKAPVKNWEYEYDAFARLKTIKETQADGGLYSFTWDNAGRLETIEYVINGQQIFKRTYTYASDGFLNTVRTNTLKSFSEFAFDYAK